MIFQKKNILFINNNNNIYNDNYLYTPVYFTILYINIIIILLIINGWCEMMIIMIYDVVV